MSALEISLIPPQQEVRVQAELPRFHVFDGSTRIVIDAHHYDDALCLCIEMGWELICACED
jgi:hypothetical protein